MLYPDELQAQCLEIRPTWQEYFGLLPSALRAVMKSNHVQIAPGDLVEPATLGLEGRCSIRMSYRRSVLKSVLPGRNTSGSCPPPYGP